MFLDKVLSDINQNVTYKIIAFLVLSLPTFQSCSQLQNIMFAVFSPEFQCEFNSVNSKFTISKDQCFIFVNESIIKCNKWNFSSTPIGSTMVTDYDLVCDYNYLRDAVIIVWYASFLSGPIFGILSDRYGRKRIVMLCLILETLSTIAVALAPNITSNFIFRILLGLSSCAAFISFTWLIESVNLEFRPFVGSFFWFYWAVGYMMFPITSFLTQDWRLSQLFSIIPSIFYLFIVFIPESPRWLLVMNRKKEMIKSLNEIAKINNIEFHLNANDIHSENLIKEGNLFTAFKDVDFRIRSIVGLLCTFSINLIYSSMLVDINMLSSNMFLSVFLLGLMELPSMLLSFFTLRYIKRKTGFCLIGGTGSIILLISVFFKKSVSWQLIFRIVLGCIAKVALTSCNQNMMVYINELFPTTHRSFGINLLQISNFLSFTGAILINKLSSVYFLLPTLIYSIFLWSVCVIIHFFLPETKDLPIPETLVDMKMLKVGIEEKFIYYMNNKEEFMNHYFYDSETKCANYFNENSNLVNEKNQ